VTRNDLRAGPGHYNQLSYPSAHSLSFFFFLFKGGKGKTVHSHLLPALSHSHTHMSTLKEILTRRPVAATIRLTVPAGGARPAPPVGPALGQYRLNLMAFCKDFNARTQKYKPDTPMAVTITAFKDNTFQFTVKSPSVTWYLKKAAGVESGSSRPSHEVASTITLRHVYEIAKVKQSDPYCQYMPLESICKSVIGTANTMGIKVVKELD
jgi:large subunit ribosomal protein L11